MIVFRESGWNGNIRGEKEAVGSISTRFENVPFDFEEVIIVDQAFWIIEIEYK